MRGLSNLTAFDDEGALHVVVESPRGSRLKYEYSSELGVFTVSRSLPLGIAYPYDWGYIPGTTAEYGDPVDAMVIHPDASYPGVVLQCRILGMVEIREQEKGKRARTNNRIIATPCWHEALRDVQEVRDISQQLRTELEVFFITVAEFMPKAVEVRGWSSVAKAEKFVRSAIGR